MIYHTMRTELPSVHLVDATTSNDILFGTMAVTPKERIADHLAALPRVKGLDQLRPVIREKLTGEVEGWEQARVLTDDQAPVEMAWEIMAFEYMQ
jgi:hypothetical protein